MTNEQIAARLSAAVEHEKGYIKVAYGRTKKAEHMIRGVEMLAERLRDTMMKAPA